MPTQIDKATVVEIIRAISKKMKDVNKVLNNVSGKSHML